MTFGEHLQELRSCLLKAVLGLIVGVMVGFLFGGKVVEWIQKPLSDALAVYYQKQSIERTVARIDALREEGHPLPEDAQQLERFVHESHMLPDLYYIDPADVLTQLKQMYPGKFKEIDLPASDAAVMNRRGDLLRMFLWHPLEDDNRIRVKTLSAQEAFSIYLKASVLVGVLITSPWIFYQLWSFVAAGLYRHEKRYIHIFLPFSMALFFAGAALAFFFVFEPVLRFLFYFNAAMGIEPDPRISEWLGFVLTLPLGFGAAFQLPLIMLFLERIGVLTIKNYWSHWKLAVLVIAVVAMILTPDPSSMMIMILPLTALYFGGIGLCYFMPRQRPRHEFAE